MGNEEPPTNPRFINPRCVTLYMELTPKQLAFLEHELEHIKDNPDRDYEDRTIAAELYGKISGEIEWEKQQHLNGNISPEEIFS
ncbi:hypothetical protein HJTV-2_gp49 [Haloarcula virus HJTV-2]|uniref:Uncharacterized protein n=1 Tax=Haloarcula virus HJTV-2 TaxID=2877986 RepID=A0AAE9BXB6_9CAUD|nr:hypothetical protein M1M33_gp098 [Haloarcula virus HJTV-2]UBF21669.1 hypothetical protein HJTV-2_gp49 [Haloarcula virus HJTV-2]